MQRLVLGFVVASLLAVGAGYAAAFLPGGERAWAPWCLALGGTGSIVALMALGALRNGRLPRSLAWTFVATFALCAGAFAAALALPANEGAGGPLLLGLPLRAAIVLYGVGLVPILVLPFAWALTFESATLSEADLERVRAARAARDAPRETAPPR